jgi:hypothetical protein
MKKRKATRVNYSRIDTRPASYCFITIKENNVYVLIYCQVWQIEYCAGGVIQAAQVIREYIKTGYGERVNVYAVSESILAIGRVTRLTLQVASSAHNKKVIDELTNIYNWLRGHSLECLTYCKLPINIYYALDYHINQLSIQ